MLNIDKLHFQGPALLVKTRRNGPAAPCLVWNDSSPNADKVDLVRFHVATKLACFFYISQSAAALSPLVFSPLVLSPLFSKATKKFYTVNALYQCQFIQLLSPFLTRPLFSLYLATQYFWIRWTTNHFLCISSLWQALKALTNDSLIQRKTVGGEGEADKNNRLPQLWGAYQLALLQERENSDSKMGKKNQNDQFEDAC